MTDILVRDLMRSPAITIHPELGLSDAVARMEQFRVQHLPLVDEAGSVVGILSDRDLLARVHGVLATQAEHVRRRVLAGVPAANVATEIVAVASAEEPAHVAAERMLSYDVHALPVLDAAGKLVGMITSSDFVAWFARRQPHDSAPWVGRDAFQG